MRKCQHCGMLVMGNHYCKKQGREISINDDSSFATSIMNTVSSAVDAVVDIISSCDVGSSDCGGGDF